MYLDGLADDGIDLNAALKMPWQTVYRPDIGPIQEGTQNWYGGVRDMTEDMLGGVGAAEETIRAHGYTGPLTGEGITEVIPGPSTDIVRVHAAPHPSLLAWLKSNGYTLKVAYPDTGRKSGFNYGSLWKDGKLAGMSRSPWSNKPGVIGYLVMGTLGAIAGGAALTAAGVIGGGSAAAGAVPAAAAPAAAAVAPAAATVAPVVSAAAPAATAVTSTGGLIATAVKAAPAVIGAVTKVAAPIIKKQQEIKAKEELVKQQEAYIRAQDAAQMPIAPPAGLVNQLMPGSATPQYERLPSTTPAWLIPAAIGGGVLLLTLLMTRRPSTAN